MLNKCSREGWKDPECTALQKIIFDWLDCYASSRPSGAPAFTCYTRRSTENDEKLLEAGNVINAWEKQVVAASTPPAQRCPNIHGAHAKAMTGKCYRVTVPENSTYVVVNQELELLFPTGCRFLVTQDEVAGQDIHVELKQDNVNRAPRKFWGTVDRSMDIELWWNGTIELLRAIDKMGFWTTATLQAGDQQVSLTSNDDDGALDKEDVRAHMRGATILYTNPHQFFTDKSNYGSRADIITKAIDLKVLIESEPTPEMIAMRQNAFAATGGQSLMDVYDLQLQDVTAAAPAAPFVDTCV